MSKKSAKWQLKQRFNHILAVCVCVCVAGKGCLPVHVQGKPDVVLRHIFSLPSTLFWNAISASTRLCCPSGPQGTTVSAPFHSNGLAGSCHHIYTLEGCWGSKPMSPSLHRKHCNHLATSPVSTFYLLFEKYLDLCRQHDKKKPFKNHFQKSRIWFSTTRISAQLACIGLVTTVPVVIDSVNRDKDSNFSAPPFSLKHTRVYGESHRVH